MIKRSMMLLCALLLLSLPALAQEGAQYDKLIMHAISNLTEVYGYTQEEAENFDFTVTETDAQWQVQFSPKAHPEWIYTCTFNKADDKFLGNSSPFYTSYRKWPGEGGIRDVLRAALQNRWFTDWNEVAKTAFGDMMLKMNINPSYALQAGLADKNYPAAQAVDDFFLTCYGEKYEWTPAIYQWRDEVLAQSGLTIKIAAFDISSRQGIHTRSSRASNGNWTYTATEFLGEMPAELTQAFSHPKLEGWTGLCGALLTFDFSSQTSLPMDCGLAAFAKGEERLLVMIYRKPSSEGWSVAPVGGKALIKNRDFFIAYDGPSNLFIIEYPISGFESECFRCGIIFTGNESDPQPMCRLTDYRRQNRDTGSGVIIGSKGWRLQAGDYWYFITTYQSYRLALVESVPVLAPDYLDFIDAAQFPKSTEECHQAAAQALTLPEGYGVASGVHLRDETSSHSDDLGTYGPGTFVQVLETLPGDPLPWYRVRIGQVEGYMCSNYVYYADISNVMSTLSMYEPLRVAKTRQAISLKKGMGWFDETVMDLPEGTKMHVLAACGDWLHVMIPQGETGWMMDVNGTDGYVKAADVVQAATSIQLDWLE